MIGRCTASDSLMIWMLSLICEEIMSASLYIRLLYDALRTCEAWKDLLSNPLSHNFSSAFDVFKQMKM